VDVIEEFGERIGEGMVVGCSCIDSEIRELAKDFNFGFSASGAMEVVAFGVGAFEFVFVLGFGGGGDGGGGGEREGGGDGIGREVFTLFCKFGRRGSTLRRILFLRWRGEGRVSKSIPSTLSFNK
jgi:hypothetical protein